MGKTCAVISCKNGYLKIVKWKNSWCDDHECYKGAHICVCPPPFVLHPFPTENRDPEARLIWAKNINRVNDKWIDGPHDDRHGVPGGLWLPTQDSRICSIHFVDGKPTPDNPHPVMHLDNRNLITPPISKIIESSNENDDDSHDDSLVEADKDTSVNDECEKKDNQEESFDILSEQSNLSDSSSDGDSDQENSILSLKEAIQSKVQACISRAETVKHEDSLLCEKDKEKIRHSTRIRKPVCKLGQSSDEEEKSEDKKLEPKNISPNSSISDVVATIPLVVNAVPLASLIQPDVIETKTSNETASSTVQDAKQFIRYEKDKKERRKKRLARRKTLYLKAHELTVIGGGTIFVRYTSETGKTWTYSNSDELWDEYVTDGLHPVNDVRVDYKSDVISSLETTQVVNNVSTDNVDPIDPIDCESNSNSHSEPPNSVVPENSDNENEQPKSETPLQFVTLSFPSLSKKIEHDENALTKIYPVEQAGLPSSSSSYLIKSVGSIQNSSFMQPTHSSNKAPYLFKKMIEINSKIKAQNNNSETSHLNLNKKKKSPETDDKLDIKKRKVNSTRLSGSCFKCNQKYKSSDDLKNENPWIGCEYELKCNSWAHYRCVGWGHLIGKDVSKLKYICPDCTKK